MAITERNKKAKVPKRPPLNHLPGSFVLGDEYRKQFNLQDGILQGQAKSWANVDDLADTYFVHNLDIIKTAPQVFQETLDDLQNIADSDIKKKNLVDYAARVKQFLDNVAIRHLFAKKFKQCVDMRGKQEEKEERRREEKQGKERLLHQGKMNGYLASLKGAMEIGASLQSDIHNLKRQSDNHGEEEGIKHRSRKKARTQTIPYILALKNSRISIEHVRYIPNSLSIFERLKLSGIRYTNAYANAVIPDELPTSMEKLIRQWQRAIEYKKYNLSLLPESPSDVSLVAMLTSTFSSITRETKLKGRNVNYNLITQISNNEKEFKMKYVSPFILSLLDMPGDLAVEWDVPSDMYDGAPAIIKRRTPNFTIRTLDNQVVCIGEIKPPNTSDNLLREDRIRLAELSKHYLHERITLSRAVKEHHVFGIFCHGENIEVYQHSYEVPPPQNDQIDGDFSSCYQFKLLKTLILPVLPHTYQFMSTSFESLMQVKNLIISSVCTDRSQPYEFQEYANNFLPTVFPLVEKDVEKLVQ